MVQFQFVTANASKAVYYGDRESIPYFQTGVCENKSVREELRGQPRFEGFYGPMWGGMMEDGEHKFDGTGTPTIRYESASSYDLLSR